MATYNPHELALIFPRADASDTQRMRKDIALYGCRVPIVLYEGKILDGLTRYDICLRCEIKPFVREFVGTREEAVAHVTSLNLCRRHLTQAQKSAVAVELKRILENNGSSSSEAIAEASQQAKVSTDSVRRMQKVAAKDTQVLKQVRDGQLSIAKAERTIDPPTNTQIVRQEIMNAVAALKRAATFLDGAPASVRKHVQCAISSSGKAIHGLQS